MEWLKPIRDQIIQSLELKPTSIVLDVAGGTGEPGLSIATRVKEGRVVITDLSEGMLEVVRDNAARKNITNYDRVACDVCELPFDQRSFDAVSCRFGFMFFPDMALAAKEMARVLKKGGRIAAAVWGMPDKNFWISVILETISKYTQTPPPIAGGPGMFRCSSPGLLGALFEDAGFSHIQETEITGKLYCITNEHYWNIMNEVAPPVASALSKVDPLTKERIKKEVFDLLDDRYPERDAAFDYSAVIVHATK